MSQAEERREEQPAEEESERGTAVLGILFLAALVGMWGVVFLLMLERGA